MSDIVFKILRPDEWATAQSAAYFGGAPIDFEDGYIHFSAHYQVEETAARYFADCSLVHVLAVDTSLLPQGLLKWEPSRGGDLFPHLYAELPMGAIAKTWELKPKADQRFDFTAVFKDLDHD